VLYLKILFLVFYRPIINNSKILISFFKFAKNYYDEFHMEYTYKIAFWERLCAKLGSTINDYASNILIVTGANSSKQNGSLDDVINQLKLSNIKFHI